MEPVTPFPTDPQNKPTPRLFVFQNSNTIHNLLFEDSAITAK